MQNLKDINLTENDFQLLVEGLEALPEKGVAGDIMGEILMTAFMKDDDQAMSEMKSKREIERREKEKKKQLLTEEIRILQGKLLQMKRYMIANGLITKVHEIIE
ncbi:hypothetical protein EZY14_002850 [Kordia sp. TARA_039_SRF]|nr:hypothetical protein EZY14_002850 [Kordia sp. TARA_039_SRF]